MPTPRPPRENRPHAQNRRRAVFFSTTRNATVDALLQMLDAHARKLKDVDRPYFWLSIREHVIDRMDELPA